jgi:iron complex outermembrane receptor protein
VFNYLGSTSAPAPAGGAVLSSNRVPSYAVSTMSGTYSFDNMWGTRQLQVYGVVSNLFDRDPPLAVGNAANNNGGTNAVFFDTQGRTYRLGVRVAF